MTELFGNIEAELCEKEENPSFELVSLINERIKPPVFVSAEDVFIRAMFLISDKVNSYGGCFPIDEHPKLAELLIDTPVLIAHSKEKLPIARNFKAELVQKDNTNWVKVWFYWLKNSEGAYSLKENIDHGIYKECSIGFVFELPECSVCGDDIRNCQHLPFKTYQVNGKEQKAFFNYRKIVKVLETSLVYRGAIPDTSFAKENLVFQKDDESFRKVETFPLELSPSPLETIFVFQKVLAGMLRYFDLRWKMGNISTGIKIFDLFKRPFFQGKKFFCEWKGEGDLKWMDFSGELAPGELGNPTLYAPAKVGIVDKGEAKVFGHSDYFWELKLDGQILQGSFIVRKVRLNKEERWAFYKKMLPD